MTKILYTKTGAIDPVMISENKHGLSDIERDQIQSYTDKQKKIQRYAGKVLVQDLTRRLKIQNEVGSMINSNSPYIVPANTGLSISLSHTEGMTICAGINNGKIGIDIEKIKEIELDLYTDYFTLSEWEAIGNDLDSFYKLWTKKEALFKAIGSGLLIDMNTIQVLNNNITIAGINYYFHSISIDASYQCTLATSNEYATIELDEISI